MNLPKEFDYDAETKELTVEFGDGKIVRYFDIDPRLAFLDKFNERKNIDFFNYLESSRQHTVECLRKRAAGGGILPCDCPVNLKSEKIWEATKEIGQPQTRPLLAQQQSRGEERR